MICAFFGYNTTYKGFLCYDPTSHRLRISRNVVFFDQQFFPQLLNLPLLVLLLLLIFLMFLL